jgi:Ser/Thr protein kinase RdoA (MazF antagonist)
VLTGAADVLDVLGLRPAAVAVLKDVPFQNAAWLLEMVDGTRVVLRRYHARATLADLAYEHAVLRYLAEAGWASVPAGAPSTALSRFTLASTGTRASKG